MTIREVIMKLKELEAEYGALEMECRNPAGDTAPVGEVFCTGDSIFIGVEGESEE